MRGLEIDVEGRTAWVEIGSHGRRVHRGDGGPRPRDRVRGHRLGRDRRYHGGRWRRLPRSQVRPDDRQPARRRRRDRRRSARAHGRRNGAGPVLGDPRWRRQLRRRRPGCGSGCIRSAPSGAGCCSFPRRPTSSPDSSIEAESAPDELSTIANVMVAPPMPFIPPEAHGQADHHRVDGAHGRRRRRRASDGAVPSTRGAARGLPSADAATPRCTCRRRRTTTRWACRERCSSIASTRRSRQTMVERLEASSATMSVVQLRVLGGAMARVPERRHRVRASQIDGSWRTSPRSTSVRRRSRRTRRGSTRPPRRRSAETARARTSTSSSDEGEDRVREAYPGPTWDRLAAIKARYDPDNLFHRNQNIPPAHQ